jgi:hypothetical protein
MKIIQKLLFGIAALNLSQALAAEKLASHDANSKYFNNKLPQEANNQGAISRLGFAIPAISNLYLAATGTLWSQSQAKDTGKNDPIGIVHLEDYAQIAKNIDNVRSESSFEEIDMQSRQNSKTIIESEGSSQFVILSDVPKSQSAKAQSFVYIEPILNNIANNFKNQEASKVSDSFIAINSQSDQIDTQHQKKKTFSSKKSITSQMKNELNFDISKNSGGMTFEKGGRFTLGEAPKHNSFLHNTQSDFHILSKDSQDEFVISSIDSDKNFDVVSLDTTEKISVNSKNIHEKIDLLFEKFRENFRASIQEGEKFNFNNNYDKRTNSILSKISDSSSDSKTEDFERLSQPNNGLVSINSDNISNKFNELQQQIDQNSNQGDLSITSKTSQDAQLIENPKKSYKESIMSFFKNAQMEIDSLFIKMKYQENNSEVRVQEVSDTISNDAALIDSKSNNTLELFDSFLKGLKEQVSFYINEDLPQYSNLNNSLKSINLNVAQSDQSQDNIDHLQSLGSSTQSAKDQVKGPSGGFLQERVEELMHSLREKFASGLKGEALSNPDALSEKNAQEQSLALVNNSQDQSQEAAPLSSSSEQSLSLPLSSSSEQSLALVNNSQDQSQEAAPLSSSSEQSLSLPLSSSSEQSLALVNNSQDQSQEAAPLSSSSEQSLSLTNELDDQNKEKDAQSPEVANLLASTLQSKEEVSATQEEVSATQEEVSATQEEVSATQEEVSKVAFSQADHEDPEKTKQKDVKKEDANDAEVIIASSAPVKIASQVKLQEESESMAQVSERAAKEFQKNTKAISHYAINHASLNAKSINNTMLKRTYHFMNEQSVGNDIAVAAGQEVSKPYTVWGSGFGGFYSDKRDFDSKTHLVGAAIGVEFPSDNSRNWGFAFSNINSNIKYNLNDKINTQNYIISLYGINKINDFTVNGSVFLGYGNIRGKRSTQKGIAKANWHNQIYGMHGIIAYNLEKNAHIITPSIATHYSYSTQSSHRESGASTENHNVSKKSAQILTSSVAIKYAYVKSMDDFKITPGFQLSISRDLMLKASDVAYKMQDSNIYTKIAPSTKKQTLITATPSVIININNTTDVQIMYSYERGNNLYGHTVALKTSITF